MFENKHNYLTNEKYRDLLWIVGTSSKPLTTYQIKEKLEEKKEFEKTSSPYVYEMIKKLHVGFIDSHFQYLFDWNKIPKDKYNTKRLLKYLKNSLQIDLDNYDNIKILNSSNVIQINIDSEKKIIIKKDTTHFAHVIYLNKDIQEASFSFLIKNKNQICIPNLMGNQLELFIDLFYSKTILFLDKELKPPYQKLVSQKREIYKKLSNSQIATNKELNREIEEILLNNKLYIYSLNIRGLILYILAEIEDEKKINSERSKGKKRKISYNPQISRVIENLAKHYSSKFPFLYNFIEMRKIIIKIDLSKNIESHYEIKILRKIAEELKHQIYFDERYSNLDLDANNNNFINYWITKRYFTEIYHYLIYIYKFLDEVKKDKLNLLLKDYQQKMLMLMKEYLEKEEKSVQCLLYG